MKIQIIELDDRVVQLSAIILVFKLSVPKSQQLILGCCDLAQIPFYSVQSVADHVQRTPAPSLPQRTT